MIVCEARRSLSNSLKICSEDLWEDLLRQCGMRMRIADCGLQIADCGVAVHEMTSELQWLLINCSSTCDTLYTYIWYGYHMMHNYVVTGMYSTFLLYCTYSSSFISKNLKIIRWKASSIECDWSTGNMYITDASTARVVFFLFVIIECAHGIKVTRSTYVSALTRAGVATERWPCDSCH